MESEKHKENLDKKQKSREYIREWRRNAYKENGAQIREKNKAYYYKYKFNLTSDDMRKYDIHLPLVAKIIKNLDELKARKPELISEVLSSYLTI